MALDRKGPRNDPGFGVTEGEEIRVGTREWERIRVGPGCVLEVCLAGSSLVVSDEEEWFAVLVTECLPTWETGLVAKGDFLGCESERLEEEVKRLLDEGGVHLCREDPCGIAAEADKIHATRVRCWTPGAFQASYVVGTAKAKVTRAAKQALYAAAADVAKRPGAGAKKPGKPGRRPKKKEGPLQGRGEPRKAEEDVIDVESGEDGDVEEMTGEGGPDRAKLRKLLQATKARMLGGAGQGRGTPPTKDRLVAEGAEILPLHRTGRVLWLGRG